MGTSTDERPVSTIRPGDHAILAFGTEAEQARVIGPFLTGGLDAGEKVIYVGDAPAPRLPGLRHRRAGANHAVGTGQLRLLPRQAACLSRGTFDPGRMRAVIGEEIVAALDQGYRSIRLTAEMSWVLTGPAGLTSMLRSESGFEVAMAADVPLMAICQFDRRRCLAGHLDVLGDVHPISVTADPEYDDGVLRITRSHAPAGLRLGGELDATRHDALMTALAPLAGLHTDIHLDLAGVRFLDLGALSRLATFSLRMPAPRVLVLDGLPPDVAGVIESLGWRLFPRLRAGRPRPLR